MGISSLGVGSSILTQNVIDQLRKADDAKFITPVDLELANTKDKSDAFNIIDANMTNLIDSIDAVKDQTVFDARTAEVSGTSVEVTASENSDVQDFTLDVTQLAEKQVEQSGAFGASTDLVSGGAGTLSLSVGGGTAVDINYDATTTLDDLKDLINKNAGDKVNATIIKISDTESRLMLNSVDTGASQDIKITDSAGGTLNTALTTDFDLAALKDGKNSKFTFNGQAVERSSNQVDDLVTGYKISLKEIGSSDVTVKQDRDSIMTKIDSFIEKYNATISELGRQTKSSTDSAERGIFSSDSSITRMQSSIENMLKNVSGGVGSMEDYGFEVDKDGVLSVNKDTLNTKMDENPANLEVFFTGGDFTNADGSTTTINGAFADFSDKITGFTEYNGILDQFKTDLTDTKSRLEDNKTTATERLDSKYEVMKKQYAAYDSMIAQLNNASSMFTSMANAQNASQNN